MSFKMDFAGFDELAADLQKMSGSDLTNVEREALKAGGEIVKKQQIANWNRSGADGEHIEDNIRVGRPFDTEEGSKIAIGPLQRLRWRAKFVERGTSRQPAQAPIEKSLLQTKDQTANAMMDILERVIR